MAMVMTAVLSDNVSLEDFIASPTDDMEWVDGQIVEKNGMTAKHSRIQSRLDRSWGNYKDSSGQGGEVYVEVPCRTDRRVRRPDVAYLTAELVAQFGDVPTLPQSPPLIAEIVSPTDIAEEIFLKAQEYLDSGCLEAWIVFPESRWILIMTQTQKLTFNLGSTVSTQLVLPGFSVAVDELLA
ncbi:MULTISPECIES: Uma2 family endonuclease [unclassified Microcoleus]|uniref:Uma2 family endonuclease n=1 Tax=unclassified Microcoleus TaxID=2642155 RepID=UPI002FD6E8F8